jgi:hypothetical protein
MSCALVALAGLLIVTHTFPIVAAALGDDLPFSSDLLSGRRRDSLLSCAGVRLL